MLFLKKKKKESKLVPVINEASVTGRNQKTSLGILIKNRFTREIFQKL